MKAFMDKDFILQTETAKKLYHDYAAMVPIIDYHCHINPKEIAEDRKFDNITQVWLGGDHYKWRFMRSCGVEEKYITGDASDYDKFCKWAECVGKAIGNPLFHWSHLELQRYFGYYGHLNAKTADEVWNICNAKLQEDSMSVRNIIRQSNVKFIGTTDDPIDSLEWHKKIKEDDSFDVVGAPSWRPDKAMNIEKPDFAEYIGKLASAAGIEIKTFADVKEALAKHGEKIAVGADIADGKIAIRGWVEKSEYGTFEFFEKLQKIGVSTVICTDISKDGAMQGTNRELYKELSRKHSIAITASGGVSTMEDIKALRDMELYGAIIGKAYYTGAIDLKQALEAAK